MLSDEQLLVVHEFESMRRTILNLQRTLDAATVTTLESAQRKTSLSIRASRISVGSKASATSRRSVTLTQRAAGSIDQAIEQKSFAIMVRKLECSLYSCHYLILVCYISGHFVAVFPGRREVAGGTSRFRGVRRHRGRPTHQHLSQRHFPSSDVQWRARHVPRNGIIHHPPTLRPTTKILSLGFLVHYIARRSTSERKSQLTRRDAYCTAQYPHSTYNIPVCYIAHRQNLINRIPVE